MHEPLGSFNRAVAEIYQGALGGRVESTTQYLSAPVVGSAELARQLTSQADAIQEFFSKSATIARQALEDDDRKIVDLLFAELPSSVGIEYHKALIPELWHAPSFFRTDQSMSGLIYELQCPGSGWGDFSLLSQAYARLGLKATQAQGFNDRFVAQLRTLTGKARPSVLHLIDNASVPWGMRYFIESTRPSIAYWGYDSDVDPLELDLVRTHSFFGLAAENLFRIRLQLAKEGKTKFDLPPNVLFDQKAPLVLPFLADTRAQFSDRVRALFPYTAVLEKDGFVDENGDFVFWDDFVSWPPSRRNYFLKYAGPDVSRNWGSRAVYRLKETHASKRIHEAIADAKVGKPWVIQAGESKKQQVTLLDSSGSVVRESRVEKVSAFYGPGGLIGAKVMYRNHFKVHGQDDTALGLIEFEEGVDV